MSWRKKCRGCQVPLDYVCWQLFKLFLHLPPLPNVLWFAWWELQRWRGEIFPREGPDHHTVLEQTTPEWWESRFCSMWRYHATSDHRCRYPAGSESIVKNSTDSGLGLQKIIMITTLMITHKFISNMFLKLAEQFKANSCNFSYRYYICNCNELLFILTRFIMTKKQAR